MDAEEVLNILEKDDEGSCDSFSSEHLVLLETAGNVSAEEDHCSGESQAHFEVRL